MNLLVPHMLSYRRGRFPGRGAALPAPADPSIEWMETTEWNYSNPGYSGNPFDIVATVTFTHASETIQQEMFYVGSDTWRVRFTGTRLGTWSWSTSSTEAALNGHSGTIEVTSDTQSRTGFFADSGHQTIAYATNDGASEAMLQWFPYDEDPLFDHIGYLSASAATRATEITAILDKIQGAGFQAVMCHLQNNVFDFGSTTYDTHTNEDPDLTTFEAMEELILEAQARGMSVHFWAWGDQTDHETPVGVGGINGIPDQRQQRYFANRLGPLPGWTISYAYDLGEWVTESEVRAWEQYMKAHMGWPHLFTAREVHADEPHNIPGVEFDMTGDRLDLYSNDDRPTGNFFSVAQTYKARDASVPHVFERRFQHGRDGVWTGEVTRRSLWEFSMAGVGAIYGVRLSMGPEYATDDKARFAVHQEFWSRNGRGFVERSYPTPASTEIAIKDAASDAMVVYQENVSTVNLPLSALAGSQNAVAVDCKATTYSEEAIGPLTATDQTWTAPYASDWAVAVGPNESAGAPSASVVTEYDLAVGNETNPYGGNHNAFPTAMGWGKDSEGARNGTAGDGSDITTYFVTNLNESGAGSLREAMEATGRRVIIPLVGGWVDVTSSIVVTDGRMTFLGQFMPAGTQGLWVRNRARTADGVMGSVIYVQGDVDHVIVRYLNIPRGIHPDFVDADLESNGNAWIHNGGGSIQQYAIWDHCTTAFTTDNCIVHLDNDYVSIQNNAFIDPVWQGAHTKTFGHDFGPHLFGTSYCFFGGNFMTRSRDRNPMMNEGPIVALGNYAYNTYILPSSRNDPDEGEERVGGNQNKHDLIRNYHREGPYLGAIYWARVDIDASMVGPGASIYMEGNEGDEVTVTDGWEDVDWRNGTSKANTERATPITVPGTIPTRTATGWRDYVHRWAGSQWVIEPTSLSLSYRAWSLHEQRRNEGVTRTGPNSGLDAGDVEAFYTSDAVPTWAIAGANAAAMEATFWNNYYAPWATANGYGTTEAAAVTVDPATGYTPLELYMMSLTPVYDYITWSSLSWSA